MPSDVELHGYITYDSVNVADSSTGPDLKNDIHPLFHKNKFFTWSTDDYSKLALPLRLASRILADDRTTVFVLNLVYGRLYPLGGVDGRQVGAAINQEGPYMAPYASTRLVRFGQWTRSGGYPINDEMRTKAKEILNALAGVFDGFVLQPKGEDGDFTTETSNTASDEGVDYFPNHERCNQISLKYSTTWDFLDHPENSVMALVYLSQLAKTMIHEIAHVLTRAVHGVRSEDVFLDSSPHNETGFELEMALFGGCTFIRDIESSSSGTTQPQPSVGLVSEEYPSEHFRRMYLAPEERPIAARWDMGKYCIAARTSLLFAASMFTERFWTVDVPSMGTGPIQPSELHRWATVYQEQGETFYPHNGPSVILGKAQRSPCSLADPNLPANVRPLLQERISQQSTPVQSSWTEKWLPNDRNRNDEMDDVEFGADLPASQATSPTRR